MRGYVLLIILVAGLPSVFAELTTEDRQFITVVSKEVQDTTIREVNNNANANSVKCSVYLDGKSAELQDILGQYQRSFLTRLIFGVFGTVLAAHFTALIIRRRIEKKGDSKIESVKPKEPEQKKKQPPPPPTMPVETPPKTPDNAFGGAAMSWTYDG